MDVERVAWSPAEAAQKLGISRTLVFDLIAEGRLGSKKVGGRRLITQAHLDAFLAD